MSPQRVCLGRSRLFAATLVVFVVGLLAFSATTRAEEPTFDQLGRDLRKAYDAADYKKALECANKMHELRRDHVDTMYNVACLHALLNEREKAYEWLDKAVDAGFRDADHLLADKDFRLIEGEERFRAAVRRIRDLQAAEARGAKTGSRPAEKVRTDAARPADARTADKPRIADVGDMPPRQRLQRIGQLTGKVVSASNAGKIDEGLEAAREALAHAEYLKAHHANDPLVKDNINGQLAITNYNYSCMLARSGKIDEAFPPLEKCVDLGGFGGDLVSQIQRDTDLDSLRKDGRFAAILEKAKKKSDLPQETSERVVDFKWKVTLPPDYDKSKKAPLVVALHHYHGSMERATERWKDAAAQVGAILLTPQGTLQLDDAGTWFSWGRDITVVEKNVMDAVNRVMDEHSVDERKVVVAGFSQGGWAAWLLALRNPDTFCGAIPVCGNVQVESDSIFDDRDVSRLRVFVMLGEDENSGVIASNTRAAERLRKSGAKVELIKYRDVAHGFPANSTEELVKALRFAMGS